MSLFDFIFHGRQKSAEVAKERLQIILAHQNGGGNHNFLPALQKDLIDVISKYVSVGEEDIRVALEKQGDYEVIEVNIVIPEEAKHEL
ncbi:cell division topological specificity factor MinE [Candidatus Ichthyocystis hellenicum]|uniref:cell division topological specificity factor MinE n=1 Tax=Candidatus Ichthyocystis hellenicum TaxID=1561003 RepID=UPI000B2ACEFB|nr:cell division topological specificity factor MinE [Candidatus Ichthyocystis hellenicum]